MESALNSSILARVISTVRSTSHLHDFAVTAETRFVEDLGFDSLDLVEVAIQLEEVFDIEFAQDAIARFGSIGDLTGYLSRRFFQDAGVTALMRAA
jgi:acyl carrier protein